MTKLQRNPRADPELGVLYKELPTRIEKLSQNLPSLSAGMLWRTGRSPWTPPFKTKLTHSLSSHRNASFRAAQSHGNQLVAKHVQLLQSGSGSNPDQLKKDVKVSGLIKSIRKQKKVAFAHVSDGTTLVPIQAILTPEQSTELTNGTYVELAGTWQSSPGKGQARELQVSEVGHIGPSNPEDNPIQKKHQTNDFLRAIPHLRLRTPFHSLLARTRSQIIQSATGFFNEALEGPVVQVQPPLITSSDCEGAGEVFTISPRSPEAEARSIEKDTSKAPEFFFREPKYLTVSSQLHLEAYSAVVGDVWTLSPTFRAEESDTPRHLSEFYMLEAEFRGLETLEDLMSRVQRLVQTLAQDLQGHRTGQELLDYYTDSKHRGADSPDPDLGDRWAKVLGEWEVLSYSDVIAELQNAQGKHTGLFRSSPSWHRGLNLEHEKWAVEHLSSNRPLFVTHYPQALKPFYMLPSHPHTESADPATHTAACFDLLLPHGYAEVVGGSLREHRLDQLIANMRDKGLLKRTAVTAANREPTYPFLAPTERLAGMEWYADLRRFGSSPHGGFGLGFDRLLAYLTGVANVRDVVAFPRTWGRADC